VKTSVSFFFFALQSVTFHALSLSFLLSEFINFSSFPNQKMF
jgi:hypothetical protein